MNKARVTLADLAHAANVSKMTVSRALRGEHGIARETRRRITVIAEKLGYRPDPAVSELMGHLRKSRFTGLEPLAWLTTYTSVGGWRSNPGTCEMYRGASEQARKLGYRLEEFSLNTPGMTARRLSGILHAQGVRGIVLAPLLEHGVIEGFAWEHFATACCGHSLLGPALHRVSVDQYDVLRTAWRRLDALGYKRIGLCVSANDNERIGHRWQAVQLVETETVSLADRVAPLITDDWSSARFLRWYEQNRPDVVLSLADAHDWMKTAGIRVPQECGFALLRLDKKGLAGVDHRFADIGASAVALAVGELSTHQYGIPEIRRSISVECLWRDGPTLRRRVNSRGNSRPAAKQVARAGRA